MKWWTSYCDQLSSTPLPISRNCWHIDGLDLRSTGGGKKWSLRGDKKSKKCSQIGGLLPSTKMASVTQCLFLGIITTLVWKTTIRELLIDLFLRGQILLSLFLSFFYSSPAVYRGFVLVTTTIIPLIPFPSFSAVCLHAHLAAFFNQWRVQTGNSTAGRVRHK